MTRPKVRRQRPRGSVRELPSGSLQVRVYAGVDPVTKTRHEISTVVPAGPTAQRDAEKELTRLLNQLDESRQPKTNATINQLLDRHFELMDVEDTTRQSYRGYARHHIRPLIGDVKVGAFDAKLMDSFYAELRRCRAHCDRRPYIEHRTGRKHDCDERCRSHICKPLSASAIRQIHFILSAAFKRAVRWRWVAVNPMTQAQIPAASKPDPRPPSPPEAAAILNEAFRDPDWGTFVWVAMTTGARRGELCALRWDHVDLDNAVLRIRSSVAHNGKTTWEKSTKTHQQRRIALDPETVELLTEHRARSAARTEALDIQLTPGAYVFSLDADNRTHLIPGSVSGRYGKLAKRLGLDTHLHNLRHYSATELISAGVDVRTVAGRLGHGGGGATTLRVYSAWVSESDQRASQSLFSRMPTRPTQLSATERAKTQPHASYERIAASYRADILEGHLAAGDQIDSVKDIAARHGVAVGTAHRAIALLNEWGLIKVARGSRATVIHNPHEREEPDP